MNLVVGDRDRLADAILERAGLALEPRPQHAQRGVGRLLARRLAADAVDDAEESARRVEVEAILVDVALQARSGSCPPRSGPCWLASRCYSRLVAADQHEEPGRREERNQQHEPEPEEEGRHGDVSGPRARTSDRRCRQDQSARRSAARTFVLPSAIGCPLSVVPSELRSTTKNGRTAGRAGCAECSRETSTGAVDPHIDGVRDAAAADGHGVAQRSRTCADPSRRRS